MVAVFFLFVVEINAATVAAAATPSTGGGVN
jgi:hypothetical protein